MKLVLLALLGTQLKLFSIAQCHVLKSTTISACCFNFCVLFFLQIQHILGYYLNASLYFLLVEWKTKKEKRADGDDIRGEQDTDYWVLLKTTVCLFSAESSLYSGISCAKGKWVRDFCSSSYYFCVNIICFWVI